jgi:DNA polymerase III epsilon subunit family exonuclease
VATSKKNEKDESWQSTFQELGTPLHLVEFVVLDLETSGSTPHLGAGITEIGAIRIKGGAVLDTFSTLVNPDHPIPPYITALTGIDDETVRSSPPISEVISSLIDFVGGDETVFVAQNAPFDLAFVKAAAKSNSKTWPKQRVVDTAILARKVLDRDEAPNCKLGTLAQIFNAEIQPTHRALDDVKATIAVLHGLFERLAGLEIFTIEELIAFSPKERSSAKARPTLRPNQGQRPNQ